MFLEPSKTFMMQPFAKPSKCFQLLIVFAKSFTLYVRLGSKYASGISPVLISKNMTCEPFLIISLKISLKMLLSIATGTVFSKIQCSSRSSCPEKFSKKFVLKIFAKFKRIHLSRNLFLIKFLVEYLQLC